uniref:Uncharacterized protein n=1 Tax=Rhipicephalus microplus TaxID=6941 RepID=A0A6G5AID1_RHIMP
MFICPCAGRMLYLFNYHKIFIIFLWFLQCFFFSNAYDFSDAAVLGAAVYILCLANLLLSYFLFSLFSFTETYANLNFSCSFLCLPPSIMPTWALKVLLNNKYYYYSLAKNCLISSSKIL